MKSLLVPALLTLLLSIATSVLGQELPIDLGLAQPYAVLAGSTVTSTEAIGTVVTGNIGIFPGSAIAGFPPAVLNGAIDSANGAAGGAQGALTTAYNVAAGRPFNRMLSNADLGGLTLFPGVYKFDEAAEMNGMLTLDAEGNPTAVWIFQIGSTLLIAEGSSIIFKDSIGNPDYVYWQAGTSVTLAIGVPMIGNIMALASITVNDGATVKGRCLARNAAVTLDRSVVTMPNTASFNTTQTLFGISLEQYNTNAGLNSATLQEGIAASITDVFPFNIQIMEVTTGPVYNSIDVSYDVVASTSMTADELQAELVDAQTDGTFDNNLHAAATRQGTTDLMRASSADASQPSSQPTGRPSVQPSSQPSSEPTAQPSAQPSARPTGNDTSVGPVQTPIDLGLAESYAILAGTTITSTDTMGTVVNGNVGLFPGSAVEGFPPAVVNGAIYAANSASGGAQGDLTAAYNFLAAIAPTATLSNQDLGGMTLPTGVYKFEAAAAMNGLLTLDAGGNGDAVWIFQIASALLIAEGSSIIFKNGLGNPDYVYWQVGSSATLAIGVPMIGNILALTSITVNDGATVTGRCLARNGAVTLDTSVITLPTFDEEATMLPSSQPSGSPTTQPFAWPSAKPFMVQTSSQPSTQPSSHPTTSAAIVPVNPNALDLGRAASYAILAGSTVTSAGTVGTVVTGNIGISPGSALVGFPPAVLNGVFDSANEASGGAQLDLTTTYNTLVAKAASVTLSGSDLGGMSLFPGVYKFDATAALTGILTLDAGGDVNAVWTFQIGSTLFVSSGSSIVFQDGVGSADYVYWQVGTSATIASAASMVGNILALASITVNAGAIVQGRCLARNGAVSLNTNEVTRPPVVAVPSVAPSSQPSSQPSMRPTVYASNAPFTDAPLDLGLAQPFVILAGSTVTSTGVVGTVVSGNIGIFPGSAITGFPPAVLHGSIDAGNGNAAGAQASLTTAYDELAAKPYPIVLSSMDLGGMTLLPGVYKFDDVATMNGMLTLHAGGDAAAIWTFQIGSTLTISEGSSIVFKDNVGNPDYVYWQVGSSATLAGDVSMVGNILALVSITVNDGATVKGRCLTRNGAVTLDRSVLTIPTVVSFHATQSIKGISLAQYEANPVVNAATLKEAIADSMTGVLPSNILNLEVTAGPTTAATILRRSLSTSSIILNYDVVVSSTMTSEQLQAQLTAAVETGVFNDNLHAAAVRNGASDLDNATSNTITTEPIVTDDTNDTPVVTDSSSSAGKPTLSGGAIAGIVVGCVALLVILAALFYFICLRDLADDHSIPVSMQEV